MATSGAVAVPVSGIGAGFAMPVTTMLMLAVRVPGVPVIVESETRTTTPEANGAQLERLSHRCPWGRFTDEDARSVGNGGHDSLNRFGQRENQLSPAEVR